MAKNSKGRVTRRLRRDERGVARAWAWVLVLAVVLFVAAVRIRVLDIPLERDEGEYAYAGQLMLQGIPPYLHVYNMKLPGVYAAYALILAAFGQTGQAIRLGLILVNAATIILVFLLARRLFDDFVGVVAAASFGLLTLLHAALGVFAHATHFVILPAVGGLILLLKATERRRTRLLFWSGLLMGVGFVMKQHGVFFVLFAGLYLAYQQRKRDGLKWRSILVGEGLLALGFVLPFGLTCLALAATGAFGKFWFWTVTYARQYGAQVPLSTGIFDLLIPKGGQVLTSAPLVWILAAMGLGILCVDRQNHLRAVFVVGLSVFSFLAIVPGLYFREHYFILLFPATALLAGAGVGFTREVIEKTSSGRAAVVVAAGVFMVSAGLLVFQERAFLFSMSPGQISRDLYGGNPFPESVEIAKYLKARTKASDTIAVLGSEPQIYFYAGRRSATSFIYMYPMMELHAYAKTMQREMMDALDRNPPEYIVSVNVPTSWAAHEGSDLSIVTWVDAWASRNYRLDGVADIVSTRYTVYRWGEDAAKYSPVGNNILYILERKSGERE